MKLKEYSEIVKQTAIYPKSMGKFYAVLGIVDEIGEVSEKIDYGGTKQEVMDEIGDTLWYVTATIREYGFDNMFDYFESVRNYQTNADKYPKYLGKTGMQIGTKLAGRLKKIIRDEDMIFTKKKTKEIDGLVRQYINTLAIIVNKMGLSFNKIMKGNINKLIDRQERGVISGDGDKR